MAARTSTSIGVGATITVLGVATLGLFITSMLFFAQRREALTRAAQADETTKDYLSPTDRNDAVVIQLKDAAAKTKKTVIRQLVDERKEIMSKATGSDRDTVKTITDAVEKEKAASLIGAIRDRNNEIDSLKTRLANAETARDRAQQDQLNESNRIKTIEKNSNDTLAALREDVAKTKAETDAMRDDVAKTRASMDERVEKIRNDATAQVTSLKSEIDKLQAQSAVDRARIREFENQQRGTRFAGQAEYALIDGQVLASTAVDGTVTLNIGRNQKVVLGLPFNVYSAGTTIKADEKTGAYPPGKATIEVIRVDADTSIARILREQKGNPVVKGDVIANPIYDPAKKYKFLVYGNFDPARTGNASSFGASEIKAWIKDWGGETIDELAGDVDFVVLGERPQLPPSPSGGAPLEVINFYIAQQKQAQRYDELFKQAGDTAIPVLNENRLRTLIGR
jgi:hypothetical protein